MFPGSWQMSWGALKTQIYYALEPYPTLVRGTRTISRLLTGTKSEEWYFSRIAERHSDVFFLQVGANDGVTEDHIHPIVRRCGWRGLLLEPMKTSYEHLVENY